MPILVDPVSTEREAVTGFLAHQQDAYRAAVHGLTDEQARRAPSASSLSLAGLIKHATLVQANWLTGALSGPDPIDEATTTRISESSDALTDDDTLDTLLAGFDEVCAQVLEAVRTLDPDTPVPAPPAPWFPSVTWSVRWVWHHLITELARHAGHADIIRETLDGGTMYPLVAAHTGLGDQPFMEAWTPAEPPVTTGVSTVALIVEDHAAARAWYTGVLDAEPYFDSGPYVEWRLGPHDHELGLLDAAVAPAHRADGDASAIVYLQVPDARAAYERLLRRGATEHWAPRDFGGGYVGASVVDPFGNVLGVMQRG